jgi:hypothetical protein
MDEWPEQPGGEEYKEKRILENHAISRTLPMPKRTQTIPHAKIEPSLILEDTEYNINNEPTQFQMRYKKGVLSSVDNAGLAEYGREDLCSDWSPSKQYEPDQNP